MLLRRMGRQGEARGADGVEMKEGKDGAGKAGMRGMGEEVRCGGGRDVEGVDVFEAMRRGEELAANGEWA
jgi:hypothetical protein